MSERRAKAIPMRRARNGSAPAPGGGLSTLRRRLGEGLDAATAPPRQMWLALLGSTTLTLRVTRDLWSRLITEGESAERWLRGHRSTASSSRPDA